MPEPPRIPSDDWPLVVGLGEALFDCFPDRAVLGGAPVNAVVHAAALLGPIGGMATPATRVGQDPLGDRFVRELSERRVPTDWAQRDPVRPTGSVAVRLDDNGDASYEFEPGCAWDAYQFNEPARGLAQRADAVLFGTLAQRSPESRASIRRFVAAADGALRLLDVNLRQSFYSAEVLDASLRLATAVKLNEEELDTAGRLLNLGGGRDEASRLAALCDAYGLRWGALTRGARGVGLWRDGQWCEGAPTPLDPVAGADSVGAGDACCAALLCGVLLGMPDGEIVSLANRLGAFVASRPGATPPLDGRFSLRVS